MTVTNASSLLTITINIVKNIIENKGRTLCASSLMSIYCIDTHFSRFYYENLLRKTFILLSKKTSHNDKKDTSITIGTIGSFTNILPNALFRESNIRYR